MKRIKRIISIMLAMLVMIMSASISIFAGFSNGNGIARSSDSDSATIDDAYYNASLYLGTTSSTASGSGSYDESIYDYFRIEIYSMVACNDGDFFDSDNGYGWAGNPGYADTYIDFDGHVGIYAESSFDCYRNGNYVINFGLHA